MNFQISRGKLWFLLLLVAAGAFTYYARTNPEWYAPIKRVLEAVYLTD